MESGTIVREEAELAAPELAAVEGEPNGFRPVRNYLSLVCMSALLEHNGEADMDTLKTILKERGVKSDQVHAGFKRSLANSGKVVVEAGRVTATPDGVEYIAGNTSRIADADRQAAEKKLTFSEVRYQLFSHIEEETAGTDGWLYTEANQTSALVILSSRLECSYRNLSRCVYDSDEDGLIHVERDDDRNVTTNMKLSEEGKANLDAMRAKFPRQITELEAGRTIKAMRSEIHNMLWELGEEPEDFEDPQAMDSDQMPDEIRRLETIMHGLEQRIDSQNS